MHFNKAAIAAILLFSFGACITQVGTLSAEDNQELASENKVASDAWDSPEETNKFIDSVCGFEEIVITEPSGMQIKFLIPLVCKDPLVDSVCDPEEKSLIDIGDSVQTDEDKPKTL